MSQAPPACRIPPEGGPAKHRAAPQALASSRPRSATTPAQLLPARDPSPILLISSTLRIRRPLVADGAPGIALTRGTLNRGLHVEQVSRLLCPIRPGSKLTTVAELYLAEKRTNAVHLATEFRTTDDTGECVSVTRTHMLYPGVDLAGSKLPATASTRRTPRAADLPAIGTFSLDESNAMIYTECSRIWNPIHTDPRVAKAAGLSGSVLHETETLARAISIITRTLPGAPFAVKSLSCLFTAPVFPGALVEVRASGSLDGTIDFEVVSDDGSRAITEGQLTLN